MQMKNSEFTTHSERGATLWRWRELQGIMLTRESILFDDRWLTRESIFHDWAEYQMYVQLVPGFLWEISFWFVKCIGQEVLNKEQNKPHE